MFPVQYYPLKRLFQVKNMKYMTTNKETARNIFRFQSEMQSHQKMPLIEQGLHDQVQRRSV